MIIVALGRCAHFFLAFINCQGALMSCYDVFLTNSWASLVCLLQFNSVAVTVGRGLSENKESGFGRRVVLDVYEKN